MCTDGIHPKDKIDLCPAQVAQCRIVQEIGHCKHGSCQGRCTSKFFCFGMCPLRFAVHAVFPEVVGFLLHVDGPGCQFLPGTCRRLIGRHHQEKCECLRSNVLCIADPPHVSRIVKIPVGDDILCAFLRIFQKFFGIAILFIFLTQVHKQVTEDRLSKSIAHLIELLKTLINPFAAVGPVAHYLVAVVFLPVIQAHFSVFQVFLFWKVWLQKGMIGSTNSRKLVQRVPVIKIHPRCAFITQGPVAVTGWTVVIHIFEGKISMPQYQVNQVCYVFISQL